MESLSDKTYKIEYTYIDCLKQELMQNEELKKFFLDIAKGYKEQIRIKKERIDQKIGDYELEIEANDEVIDKKLSIIGLNFSGFDAKGFKVNGVKISYNYLLDDDSFDSRKQKLSAGYLPQRRMELAELITRNRAKLEEKESKKSIFGKKKNDDKIASLQKKLNSQERELNEIQEAISAYEVIDNLTNDQKILLLEIIKLKKGIYEIKDAISSLKSEQYEKNVETEYSEKTLNEAIKYMIESNIITTDDLQKVFLTLDKIEIKARRGEYEFKNQVPIVIQKLEPVIKGFIKDVYEEDEKFVERNKQKIKSNN